MRDVGVIKKQQAIKMIVDALELMVDISQIPMLSLVLIVLEKNPKQLTMIYYA